MRFHKLIIIFLLLLMIGSIKIYAAGGEWLEGFSRLQTITQLSRFKTSYDLLIANNDRLVIAGIDGGYHNMGVFIEIDGTRVYDSNVFFAVEEVKLLQDYHENFHLFWICREYEDHFLYYTFLDPQGNIIKNEIKLEQRAGRILNLTVTEQNKGLHLLWTVGERPNYFINYLEVKSSGEIGDLTRLDLTTSGIPRGNLLVDSQGDLHLFWRESDNWRLNLWYQKFLPTGETLNEALNLFPVAFLDRNMQAATEVNLVLKLGADDTILGLYSGQNQETGRDLGAIIRFELQNGQVLASEIVSPLVRELKNFSAVFTTDQIHLSWLQIDQNRRMKPYYMIIDYDGTKVKGPLLMDYGFADALNPSLALYQDNSMQLTWQRYAEGGDYLNLMGRNSKNPEPPPLGYRLGFGDSDPLIGYFYVMGIGLSYSVVITLTQGFIILLLYLLLLQLKKRKLLEDLERYPIHCSLMIFSGLFLLLDTPLHLFRFDNPGSFFAVLTAILSSFFVLIMKKDEKKMLELNSSMGWVFIMLLWVYWNTLFSLIPYLILSI